MHGPGARDAAPTNACGQLCHLRSLRCSESTRRGGKSIRCCTPMTSRPREARQDYQHHRTRHNTADGAPRRYHLHHSRRCRSLLVDMHVNRKQKKKNHGCPRPLPALKNKAGRFHHRCRSSWLCGVSTVNYNLTGRNFMPPLYVEFSLPPPPSPFPHIRH